MREFGIIGTVIWGSRKFRRLKSDDARLAYFYLHTNRLSTSAGCYQLPESVAIADLGWTKARWHRALADLVRVNLIEIDAEEACVYLVNFPRIVRPLGPSHLTGIFKLLAKVPSRALADKMAAEFNSLRPKLKLTLQYQNQNQYKKESSKKEKPRPAPPPLPKGASASEQKPVRANGKHPAKPIQEMPSAARPVNAAALTPDELAKAEAEALAWIEEQNRRQR